LSSNGTKSRVFKRHDWRGLHRLPDAVSFVINTPGKGCRIRATDI
jgi:hypothetical protein